MPRFFLHHVSEDGTFAAHPEPQDFRDLAAAEQEAILSIRSIAGDRLLAGDPFPSGRVEICDELGVVHAILSYYSALNAGRAEREYRFSLRRQTSDGLLDELYDVSFHRASPDEALSATAVAFALARQIFGSEMVLSAELRDGAGDVVWTYRGQ